MTSSLTRFLMALMAADPARLAKADPEKLAAKYKISPAHARGYIDMARGW